ncbi:MAG TPA: glycosyltransferase [Lunatimonas sp.]|nr:glycosyltransferase [Lunatimonas sp.]
MYPKILILEQPFDKQTGGGITLSNLFSGWETDRLAVVCSGYLINDHTNFDICSKYYQIGELEHQWRFPFNLIKRKYPSGEIDKKKIYSSKVNKIADSNTLRMRLINHVFYPVLNYFGLNYFFNKIELSVELCRWLDIYNPDIVYAQPSSRQSVLFCYKVQRYLNKPFVFHMMDDWPTVIKHQGLFGNIRFKKVERDLKMLFENTNIFLGVSEFMAEEYYKRYNQKFITFHNPIDIAFWEKYRKRNYKIGKQATILYAGRVGVGIDSSLETIAKATFLVNEKYKINLSFHLQTQEKPNWIDKYRYVRHNEFVEYDLLPKVFAEADLLILPYDFSLKSLHFIRFSMPTKAPEYLACRTPVIIFAPGETALVKYAEKNNCAFVITKNSVELLAENIVELLADECLREKLGTKGSEFVDKFHNAENIRRNFRILLTSLNK